MPSDSGLVYDTSSITAVTVTASHSTTLKASEYGTGVVTIDASARTRAIYLNGNDKNNVIIGGSGNDTFYGGNGNDTYTGSAGKDVFIYETGNDVITDYTAGEDTLRIASDTISSYGASGNDVTFKVGSGSVKLTGAKSDAITIVDSSKKAVYYKNGILYNANPAKATFITVTSAYDGALTADEYGTTVVTIDAGARTKGVNLTGNAKNNRIMGSSAADTIYANAGNNTINAGAGNDTIYSGTGNDTLTGGDGNDVFIYNGTGNDVITDYTAGADTLRIASGAITSYSTSNAGDLTIKIGSGSVKILGGKNTAVSIVESTGSAFTYQDGLVYNNLVAKATALTVSAAYGNTLAGDVYGTSVVTLDASVRTRAIDMTGNAKNNYMIGTINNDVINGGAGADTIIAGLGNDTLYGGDGNDVFIYNSGDGADVIADYAAGADTIRLTDATLAAYSVSGSNAIFSISGGGSIKVLDGKDIGVTIVDSTNSALTYQNYLVYNNTTAKATALTVTADYTGELSSDSYGTAVVTLDASAHATGMSIGGNAKNNVILGTVGDDTLGGGAGNDTLYGGGGSNLFVYTAGNDVIADYVAGSDTLQISGVSITSVGASGNDVTLKAGSGSVKVVGAKDKTVTITDGGDNVKIYDAGVMYSGSDTEAASVMTITGGTSDVVSAYGASVATIDATARTTAVRIVGNTLANKITGTTANDTLEGGAGNDTLIGGKGNDLLTGGEGRDVFVYNNGEGNDTITDYTAGEDIISIAGASIGGYSVTGRDVVVKVSSGNITLQDGVGKEIRIVGATGTPNVRIRLDSEDGGDSDETVAAVTFDSDSLAATINPEFTDTTFDASAYEDLVTIDASHRGAVEILGNENGNVIIGSSGNDTVSLGTGLDTYIYAGAGDFDIVEGYRSGADKISIGAASISGGMVVGSDVYFAIGRGVLKLTDGADKIVTVVGSGGNEMEYLNGAVYIRDTTPAGLHFNEGHTALTIGTEYSGKSFDAAAYVDLASITVEASGVNLAGNSLANEILNTSVNSAITIDGAGGNDTIDNYAAKVFVDAGDGSDRVYNYGVNVTVDGGAGTDRIYNYGNYASLDGGAGIDRIYNYGSYVTIQAGAGNDYVYNYSGVNISISGGDGADRIYNYSSNVTINGGAGDDLISLRADHSGDVIQYAAGDGNDTIYGLNSNDTLRISGVGYSTQQSGNDVVVAVGGNSILLKNYSGNLKVVGTAVSGRSSNAVSALWFTEDENFDSGGSGLDEIVSGGDSVANAAGALSVSGGATANFSLVNIAAANIFGKK